MRAANALRVPSVSELALNDLRIVSSASNR